MCSGIAKCDGEHLDKIVHGDLGLGTCIGSEPEEDPVKRADSELECRDGHGEPGCASGGLEGEFVGDVVVVVSDVPEGEVD